MDIITVRVINRTVKNELSSIYYDFNYTDSGFIKTQRIIEKYKNGELIETDFKPAYKYSKEKNDIFIKRIAELKKENNIHSFYKKIEEDILSLNFNFESEFCGRTLILKTNFDDYQIQLEFSNSYFNVFHQFIIKRMDPDSNINFELYIEPNINKINIDKILKGKNKIKYLLDTKVINFIKEYKDKVSELKR